MAWERKRLLIWGKTYPEFSKTYYETVCTGAIDAATGRLVRIYPITLRHLDDPFHAFDWIEADVERNTSDYRPESYRIRQDTIRRVGKLATTKAEWPQRRRWVLGPANVFRSVEQLQEAQERDHTSLGLVEPSVIKRFKCRTRSPIEHAEWNAKREEAIGQKDLFVDVDTKARDLEFPWAEYRVEFTCDDATCAGHDFSILDWGLYVLDRKQTKAKGYHGAEADVIAQLQAMMCRPDRDSYFFLGNTKAHPQSFMVVGLFSSPIVRQGELFPLNP